MGASVRLWEGGSCHAARRSGGAGRWRLTIWSNLAGDGGVGPGRGGAAAGGGRGPREGEPALSGAVGPGGVQINLIYP